ncbi:MAG: hypothetical protein IKD83_04670, partial [Firmicutes bacterium]|nr:hypothetical protein [Bacillota bacterium]
RIMKIFGFGYGMRRFGLWISILFGLFFGYLASSKIKASHYYKLRHIDEYELPIKGSLNP